MPAARIVREPLEHPLCATTVWCGDQCGVIVPDTLTDLQAATVAMHAAYAHAPVRRGVAIVVGRCEVGACAWAHAWTRLLLMERLAAQHSA